MADDFVPQFVSRLRGRLEELELEKARLVGALRILEANPGQREASAISDRLLDRIAAFPGSRSSLLALEFGLTTGTIRRHLETLEEKRLIVRSGLGWEATAGNVRRVPPEKGR